MPHCTIATVASPGRANSELNEQPSRRQPAIDRAAVSPRHDDSIDDDDDDVDTLRLDAAEKQRLVASAFASDRPRLAVAPHAIIRVAGRPAIPASFPRRAASLVMPDAVVSPAPLSPPLVAPPPSGVRRHLSRPIARAARAFRDVRLAVRACLRACAGHVRLGTSSDGDDGKDKSA